MRVGSAVAAVSVGDAPAWSERTIAISVAAGIAMSWDERQGVNLAEVLCCPVWLHALLARECQNHRRELLEEFLLRFQPELLPELLPVNALLPRALPIFDLPVLPCPTQGSSR